MVGGSTGGGGIGGSGGLGGGGVGFSGGPEPPETARTSSSVSSLMVSPLWVSFKFVHLILVSGRPKTLLRSQTDRPCQNGTKSEPFRHVSLSAESGETSE